MSLVLVSGVFEILMQSLLLKDIVLNPSYSSSFSFIIV